MPRSLTEGGQPMKYPRQDQLLLTVKDACRIGGFGNTVAYELIRNGRLDARKLGRRTLITVESLQRLADSLPKINGRES